MVPADDARLDQALDWVRRIADPDFAAWDAHLAWLEADPRNPAAFDDANLLVEAATDGLSPAPPAPPASLVAARSLAVNDNVALDAPFPRRRYGRWLAGAVTALAASLLAVVAYRPAPTPQSYLVETGSGARRTVTLADGTRIAVNGGSSLRLWRGNPRLVRVERGEAFFEVTHDPQRPFAVEAGDARFEDVGTSFDILREPGTTSIAVREGAVMFDPAGAAVRLAGGQAMRIEAGNAVVSSIDAESAGGWRDGRLVYRDAGLSQVAADVTRATGVSIGVDPRLSGRRFSGVIILDRDHRRLLGRLGAVLGVALRDHADGLHMEPAGR